MCAHVFPSDAQIKGDSALLAQLGGYYGSGGRAVSTHPAFGSEPLQLRRVLAVASRRRLLLGAHAACACAEQLATRPTNIFTS